ncbi:5'-nucleotidase [Devosia sp. 17-2-E-8]|nr:5'-nucleotidase [Devosia sp. 17-2-E-8]
MGLFDDIKAKIFGAPATATPAPNTNADDAAKAIGIAAANRVAASLAPTPTANVQVAQAAPAPTPAPAAPPAAAPAAPSAPVDVAAVLDAAVAKAGQKLDWRKSIVDLMKALGLDSSLAARKQLAAELGYKGDTGDSAAMNIWLHKQVIQKLKDNGGKVPADLL